MDLEEKIEKSKYSKYDSLVESFIKSYKKNDYQNIKEILNEVSYILDKNDPYDKINMHRITEKLILALSNKEKPSEKEIRKFEKMCYKEIRNVFHSASYYSLIYALNDIGGKMEKFVIIPELIEKISYEARIVVLKILKNGYLYENETVPDILSSLEKESVCFIDSERRLFLTAKGVNLARYCLDFGDSIAKMHATTSRMSTETKWKEIQEYWEKEITG